MPIVIALLFSLASLLSTACTAATSLSSLGDGSTQSQGHDVPKTLSDSSEAVRDTQGADEPSRTRGTGSEDIGAAEVSVQHGNQGTTLRTRLESCELVLTVEGERMWWRADAMTEGGSCDLLSPELRPGWARLMRSVSETEQTLRLSVVIDFYRRHDAVARSFRAQRSDESLRRVRPKRNNAAFNARLAAHLAQSDALEGYRATFSAMGMRISSVAVEKVEVRRWSSFHREDRTYPPAPHDDPIVALPFMTWVTLTRE